jgi:hypothetical protein
MRKNELKCYLTDDELKQVTTQASRELIDPAMWLRRVGVAVADGTARIVSREREELNVWA